MADIINLRGARKARNRREAEKLSEANRLAFGRSRAERELAEREKSIVDRRLDGHRRENDGSDEKGG